MLSFAGEAENKYHLEVHKIKMAVSKAKTAAIAINLVVFIIVTILNYFSTKSGKVFPKATGKVSDDYQTEVTPAGSTFAIWGFIYIYQLAWVIYSLTLLCRNAPDILPTSFYVSFTFATIFNLSWLLVWSREHLGLAFVFIALIGIFLEASLYFSFTSLERYIEKLRSGESPPSATDVWCIRMLVHNGIIFYTTWVTVATCLNMTIVLQYDLEANGSKAALGSLIILFLIIVVWFLLENFVFAAYTRFTFTEYIVLVVALSGILKKNWTDGKGNQGFVMFLLVLSAILLILRLVVIFVKERKLGFRI